MAAQGAFDRIYLGVDGASTVAALVGMRKALVMASRGFRRRPRHTRVLGKLALPPAGIIDAVVPTPGIEDIANYCSLAEKISSARVIIAIGGGSVIDAAKLVASGLAGWARSPDTIRQFLKAGGRGVGQSRLTVIAVPTTAGTGSEATPFATLWDHAKKAKHSIEGSELLPEVAVLDPNLTLNQPIHLTCSSGLDAISQALESWLSPRATSETDRLAIESLRLSLTALSRLLGREDDLGLRADMQKSALRAGQAIAHTRTGLAHAISYPLTARFGVPHGIACSFTLPVVWQRSRGAASDRIFDLENSLGRGKLEVVLRDLLTTCGVGEQLKRHHFKRRDVLDLAGEMLDPHRVNNSKLPATPESVRAIVAESLDSLGVN